MGLLHAVYCKNTLAYACDWYCLTGWTYNDSHTGNNIYNKHQYLTKTLACLIKKHLFKIKHFWVFLEKTHFKNTPEKRDMFSFKHMYVFFWTVQVFFIRQKFCFQFHLMSICIPGPVSWNWANIANHDKASMFKQLISALKENPWLRDMFSFKHMYVFFWTVQVFFA
jgi:hypothetical protein